MKLSLRNSAVASIMAIMSQFQISAQTHNGDHMGGGEEFTHLETTSVGFIMANQNVSDDEAAAMETFRECYPHSSYSPTDEDGFGFASDQNNIITCGEFTEDWATSKDVKAIWIHINREGVVKGWQNLPDGFSDPEFVAQLRAYSMNGGKLYLSGLATQLLVAIGRQPEAYAPNVYNGDVTAGFVVSLPDNDPWGVTGRLHGVDHDGLNSFGHAKHAIYGQPDANYLGYYAALTPKPSTEGEETSIYVEPFGEVPYKWNILGAEEGKTINVSDNNCMWNGDMMGLSREEFRRRNNCQIPGSWGQETPTTVNWGIVEFLPDNVDGISGGHDTFGSEEQPWRGNTVANGMACFQYANKADNKYYDNLRNMTFNTINYLSGEERVISSGVEAVDACLENEGNVSYYTLQGVRVVSPRVGDIYIMTDGKSARKIIIR